MEKELGMRIAELLELASRASRLAAATTDDLASSRLQKLAKEYEEEIKQLAAEPETATGSPSWNDRGTP